MASVVMAEKRRILLEEAWRKAPELHFHRQERQNTESEILNQDLGRRAQQDIWSIAKVALADLASVNLENRIGEAFLGRLGEMDHAERKILQFALRTSPVPAMLRSAFELAGNQREEIRHALDSTFGFETTVVFQTDPGLLGGFEFSVNGQKVAWSLSEYIHSLEKSLSELFNRYRKPDQTEVMGICSSEIPEGHGLESRKGTA